MNVLIALALIVCIAALVITLAITKTTDTNYGSNRSIKNLSVIYLIVIPVIAIVIVIFWVIFN